MDDSTQQVRTQLEEWTRQKSAETLRTLGNVDPVTVTTPVTSRLVHGHRMALILVSSPVVRVTFKVHFRDKDSEELLRARIKSLQGSPTSDQVIDYFKEYCNVMAGALKALFRDAGVEAGISLPLSARGFDELFFPSADQQRTHQADWNVFHPFGSFRCSIFYQIIKSADFEKLPLNAFALREDTNAGEMELL